MPFGKRFIFGGYTLDTYRSIVTFEYKVETDTSLLIFTDTVQFSSVSKEMWERVPPALLQSFLQTLSLMLGIVYWKVHTSPKIEIEGWSLSREQAELWNQIYTKGLGEFFYFSQIDFRGLVSFPFDLNHETGVVPSYATNAERVLVAHGGGKDSTVVAEMLKESNIPFDLFSVTPTRMQQAVAQVIGGTSIEIHRARDSQLVQLRKDRQVKNGNPAVVTVAFAGALLAILHGYRYIIFGNEQSADIGNVTYRGMEINHQWSKSTEAELLVREYLARFVTRDVIPFSLVRQFTDAEMARRFAKYPKYFPVFSSCNTNFFGARAITQNTSIYRAHWCNKCPKCAFMFACLSAFLPKQAVIEIFGANLYADSQLVPMYERLLGIKGSKPFECIGTAEEVIAVMEKARISGAYAGDVAMALFEQKISPQKLNFSEIERRIFSVKGKGIIPDDFAPRVASLIFKE
jgi:hypothetical protein